MNVFDDLPFPSWDPLAMRIVVKATPTDYPMISRVVDRAFIQQTIQALPQQMRVRTFKLALEVHPLAPNTTVDVLDAPDPAIKFLYIGVILGAVSSALRVGQSFHEVIKAQQQLIKDLQPRQEARGTVYTSLDAMLRSLDEF